MHADKTSDSAQLEMLREILGLPDSSDHFATRVQRAGVASYVIRNGSKTPYLIAIFTEGREILEQEDIRPSPLGC
jgi:hypothetical protein